jgi:hypothetical protein
MMHRMTESEARAALLSIDDRRRQVLQEVDMPGWYWWAVAAGWVAIGLLTDFGPSWASGVGTFLFGASHAAVAPRVLTGRHRTGQLSVHRDLVDRRIPALVFAGLLVMVAVSAALGFALHADGAEHPVTIASLVVGVVIVLGGSRLMAAVRRHAGAGRDQ